MAWRRLNTALPAFVLLGAGCAVVDESAVAADPVEARRGIASDERWLETRSTPSSSSSSAPREPESLPTIASPCPSDMVLAGRACIDRYEAHLLELGRGGTSWVHPHFERPQPGKSYVAANEKGSHPQGYISRVEASQACLASGKRLCTRGEWMTACQGTPLASCNRAKAHLLPVVFPERNWVFHYDEHFNHPALNQVPGFLAIAGEYDGCTSDAGAHDLVGNLHEWVSDPVTREFASSFEGEMRRQWQPIQVGNGVFMGGFYSTQNEHGAGCAFTTVAHEPAYHDYSTGFRCCRSPVLLGNAGAADIATERFGMRR